jgi:hypothetical protein
MPQTASSVQIPSVEGTLKFIRNANDLAAMLADFTARVRLIRTQHAVRVATLAS